MKGSALKVQIVSRIKQKIQISELKPGDHLSVQKLADQFGVSRSPARDALICLAQEGWLEQIPNRGFFVTENALAEITSQDEVILLEDPPEYYRIAEDWVNSDLPEEVTELYLRNRYGLTKVQVVDVLNRAARVGWAEPKPGYGWRFLEVAKTQEGLELIYRARALIEPAALLEPTFNHDLHKLREMKQEQKDLLNGGIDRLPADVLIKAGWRFHEELIKLSGNFVYHRLLVQLNNMRKVLEYRSMINRKRLVRQTEEHLQMIELVEMGNNLEAAHLMKRHLSGSLAEKTPILQFPKGYEESLERL